MSRSCKIIIDFFICQSKLLPYSGRNSFISYQCQRHINTMKSHPVYFFLPTFPIPIRSRISKSTHIHIVMVRNNRGHFPLSLIRPFIRQFTTSSIPTKNTPAVFLYELIKATAQRHITATSNM